MEKLNTCHNIETIWSVVGKEGDGGLRCCELGSWSVCVVPPLKDGESKENALGSTYFQLDLLLREV